MSTTPPDFTYILDPNLPPVNRQKVRPSVKRVAMLLRTRTVDSTGEEQGTFTTDTRPTFEECEMIIDQALEMCLLDLPDNLPEAAYPRILQAVTAKTAFLIELSFFREQFKQGSAQGLDEMYDKMIASIELLTGGSGGGQQVDSPLMRSSMAEYDPDYSMPPPRVITRTIPWDGNPYSEVDD